jgi:hypothetical protein
MVEASHSTTGATWDKHKVRACTRVQELSRKQMPMKGKRVQSTLHFSQPLLDFTQEIL